MNSTKIFEAKNHRRNNSFKPFPDVD